MTNTVGFVGYESEDIVLLLAKCLTSYGKRVAIEDRTEQGMLLRILELEQRIKPEAETSDMEYQGIVVSSLGVQKEMYDIVFLLFGYRLKHPKLYECETLVMVTDALPAHAAALKSIGQWERKQCLVVRNYIALRHGIRYLETLSNHKFEKVYCLEWVEQDMKTRCCLGLDEELRMWEVSLGMRELLKELLCFLIPDIPEKFLKKIGKRNRRGMAYWEN